MPEYEVNWHHKLFCSYLDRFVSGDIKRLMIFCPPRHGKLISDFVPVLTSEGFKRHGDLQVGDKVYHPSGKLTKVIATSPRGEANYELEFSNGEVVQCHENHEWCFYDRTSDRWRKEETHFFHDKNRLGNQRSLRNKTNHSNFLLPRCEPLEFSERIQDVSPYMFGLWLMDAAPNTLIELQGSEKYIPDDYLLGSLSQRKRLLAGILDARAYVFRATRRIKLRVDRGQVLEDLKTLLSSLRIHYGVYRDGNKDAINFQLNCELPTMARKYSVSKYKKRIAIVRVEKLKIPDRGKCIQVEASDGLYLVGKTLIPTHNSELVSRRLPAFIFGRDPNASIIATSYGADLASRMNRDVQRIMGSNEYKKVFPDSRLWEKNIRTVADGSYLRNSEIFEIVNHKGVYRSAGVGGGITGMGGKFLICLPEGQKLKTNHGELDIAQIVNDKIDCLILSYNHKTRLLEYKAIEAYEKNAGRNTLEFDLGDRSFECTLDHPVYVVGKGYINADQVCVGDLCLVRQVVHGVRMQAVKAIYAIKKTHDYVYNVRVKDNHNYFANGVLVHNCDDPIKNAEEAYSSVYREKVWEWFTSTFFTRLEKSGGICITLTRWHDDDMAGRLLKLRNAHEWTLVSLPAIRENMDFEDDPRAVGEALWPNKYSLEDLENIKHTIGSRDWNSLFRQQPSNESGNMFNPQFWRRYRKSQLPPKFDMITISCDMTFKDSKTSDYVVMQVWGKIGTHHYLLDQVRNQMSFLKSLNWLLKLAVKWKNLDECLIEEKANGAAIIDVVRNKIPSVIPIVPKESKEARAASCVPTVEAGNVFLPVAEESPYIIDFIEELKNFPKSKHDDMCDAFTQYIRRSNQDYGWADKLMDSFELDNNIPQNSLKKLFWPTLEDDF